MGLKSVDRDSDGYTLEPIPVSNNVWLYADRDGMTVVHEVRDHNGKHVTTVQSVVPWRLIDKARERG